MTVTAAQLAELHQRGAPLRGLLTGWHVDVLPSGSDVRLHADAGCSPGARPAGGAGTLAARLPKTARQTPLLPCARCQPIRSGGSDLYDVLECLESVALDTSDLERQLARASTSLAVPTTRTAGSPTAQELAAAREALARLRFDVDPVLHANALPYALTQGPDLPRPVHTWLTAQVAAAWRATAELLGAYRRHTRDTAVRAAVHAAAATSERWLAVRSPTFALLGDGTDPAARDVLLLSDPLRWLTRRTGDGADTWALYRLPATAAAVLLQANPRHPGKPLARDGGPVLPGDTTAVLTTAVALFTAGDEDAPLADPAVVFPLARELTGCSSRTGRDRPRAHGPA